jgi:hypothetical protein
MKFYTLFFILLFAVLGLIVLGFVIWAIAGLTASIG